jgi:uncharacterized repeat protein (TIGR03803 family)
MQTRSFSWSGVFFLFLIVATAVGSALADDTKLVVLYSFEPLPGNSQASQFGSQPDTRPVLGPGNVVYGMTSDGGVNGNGVIYSYNLKSHKYTVLHTFGAVDANGNNSDGAYPGVALTLGPDDVLYGMAQFGGPNGNGTIFKITASGNFTALHTFSALDANAHNQDGANPLRTIVVGSDGNLYGTTRLGGTNTCGTLPALNSCGVAWVMDRSGHNFRVLHQFSSIEGHAASLLEGHDGNFYGCAVWPSTSLPNGTPLPSGILYRMAPSGQHFEVLYKFSQTNANGANADGAECYEPLVETEPGVFYGTTTDGGTNANGTVFRYSLANPKVVDTLHTFSALTSAGANWDGATPIARLTLGNDGHFYSTASFGGLNGNGVVYRMRPDGYFEVLHTFSATDATTGANEDGATPDFGVILNGNDSLIGMTDYGGSGSSAGFYNSGGTLYQLKLEDCPK